MADSTDTKEKLSGKQLANVFAICAGVVFAVFIATMVPYEINKGKKVAKIEKLGKANDSLNALLKNCQGELSTCRGDLDNCESGYTACQGIVTGLRSELAACDQEKDSLIAQCDSLTSELKQCAEGKNKKKGGNKPKQPNQPKTKPDNTPKVVYVHDTIIVKEPCPQEDKTSPCQIEVVYKKVTEEEYERAYRNRSNTLVIDKITIKR